MSEPSGAAPETIDTLLASMRQHGRNETHLGLCVADGTEIMAILMRDTLVPTVQGLAHELAETRAVLAQASTASERYARALARATWWLAIVTGVLALTAVIQLIHS